MSLVRQLGPALREVGAARLGLLFGLVPATFLGAQAGFLAATLDLAQGGWAEQLAGSLGGEDSATRGLLGGHSRFVWAALAVLFPVLMATAAAAGLIVLARLPRPYKAPALVAAAALAALTFLGFWLTGAGRLAGCLATPCGPACATTSGEQLFLIIPYMGRIFCSLYDSGFVAVFLGFFTLAGPLQSAVTVLLYAAALSLILRPASAADREAAAGLRRGTADFRLLLVLSSALLTYTGLMELSLWGWLAEIGAEWDEDGRLRNLQVGSTLYWGICNSASLLLLYLPLASLLKARARALAEARNPDAALPALETWERDQGITLMGRGAWPQVVSLLAPLLTGAFAFLFQSALGG